MNAVIDPNSFSSTAAAPLDANKGRGNMDEVLKRLGILEVTVTDVRLQLASVIAVLPHLATKADLQAVRTEVQAIRTDVQAVRTDLQGQISGLIKWIVGTGLGAAGVAAAVATAISKLMG